jgi:hypothetical protein
MAEISYRRHRVPPVIIQHAVWLYLRFTLRYRDVEELLAERGLDISYETVRCWVLKFGPVIARPLRRCLDALNALAVGIGNTRVNWVLDANRARGIIGKGQVLPYTHRGRIGGLPPMD